ncbi:Hypothetical Protein OBI_RACECAR_88 [Arthrobacter phage Racecar]|nr:hypothetical protein PBI_RACECAR_170 [Arthrobacter phage Racecar]QFG12936.1 hypothetical protein PBI_MIMI_167 [Arthrobacter phage Mimi]
MAKFVLHKASYDHMVKAPKGETGRFLAKRAEKLVHLSRRQVGKKTRALERSISYKVVRDGRGLVAVVGSSNRVALMHHQGTRPHIILPKRAKTLRFYSRGRIVYSKMVRHPGTKPNRYLTDNLRRVV